MEEEARLALIGWAEDFNVRTGGGPIRLPGLPNQALTALSGLDRSVRDAEIDHILSGVSVSVRGALKTLITRALDLSVTDHVQVPLKAPARPPAKQPQPTISPTVENEPLRRLSYLETFDRLLSVYKLEQQVAYLLRPITTRLLVLPINHPAYQDTPVHVLYEAILDGAVLVQEWKSDKIIFVPAKRLTPLQNG